MVFSHDLRSRGRSILHAYTNHTAEHSHAGGSDLQGVGDWVDFSGR